MAMSARRWCLSLVCFLAILATPTIALTGQTGVTDTPVVDLAAVPLVPGDLAESGFQLDTAGYILDESQLATILGEQRNADDDDVIAAIDDADWDRSYGHRVQLLADRGTATSDPLASVTTWLHEFASKVDAERALALWIDAGPAEADGPAPRRDREEHVSRQIVGNEDTIRTLVVEDTVVVEVTSGDAQRTPNRTIHDGYVDATIDRLATASSNEAPDVGTRALLLRDDSVATPFMLTGRQGSYQAYRVNDGVVMPNLGELEPATANQIAPGLDDLFVSQQVFPAGRTGTGLVNLWLGQFEDDGLARALARQPMAEQVVEVERIPRSDDGAVYRVSGSSRQGERYSGYRIVARFGSVVQIVTWNVQGSGVADLEIARLLADPQGMCLDREPSRGCTPVVLASVLSVGDTVLSTPDSSDDDPGTYRSRQFGWSVPYEAAGWLVAETFEEEGYDYIEFRSAQSAITLESVIDHHGDPQQCVLDNLESLQLVEERADIMLGSDLADEPPAGSAVGRAWAIYTVEPLADERADQEYTIRIDCLTVVPGDVSLVVTHRAPRDSWAEESARAQALRDEIVVKPRADGKLAFMKQYSTDGGRIDMYMPRIWIPLAA